MKNWTKSVWLKCDFPKADKKKEHSMNQVWGHVAMQVGISLWNAVGQHARWLHSMVVTAVKRETHSIMTQQREVQHFDDLNGWMNKGASTANSHLPLLTATYHWQKGFCSHANFLPIFTSHVAKCPNHTVCDHIMTCISIIPWSIRIEMLPPLFW